MAKNDDATEGGMKPDEKAGSLPKNIGHIKELVNDENSQLSGPIAEAMREAEKER